MSLDHILLALLNQPASGYDLKKEFERGARHYWAADLAQIYPTLKKLESKGLLSSSPAGSDKGPPRRVYTRTVDGREELLSWLRQGPVMGKQRLPYLAQLEHLYELGDLNATFNFVTELRSHFAAFHRFLSEVALDDVTDMNDALFHEHLTLDFGVTGLAARVAWCDRTLERISERRGRQKAP